jgi:hypothetical protein
VVGIRFGGGVLLAGIAGRIGVSSSVVGGGVVVVGSHGRTMRRVSLADDF